MRVRLDPTSRPILDISLRSSPDAVLVAGMGRTGTTWIAELLNFDDRYRLVFEPFRIESVEAARAFADPQYLRPDERRPQLAERASDFFHGTLGNAWTDRYARPLVSTRRIVKAIRANLMLGWLKRLFPGVPFVLVIRHPLAVVASWRRLGWGTPEHDEPDTTAFDRLVSVERIFEDFPRLAALKARIAPDSYLDRQLFLWCVSYAVPLAHLSDDQFELVHYENLVLDPHSPLSRLFSYVGRGGAEAAAGTAASPSLTGYRELPRGARRRMAFGWRDEFETSQRDRARRIMGESGLAHLYDSTGHPADGVA